MKQKPNIVYIISAAVHTTQAQRINAKRRKRLLENLGYNVLILELPTAISCKTLQVILVHIRRATHAYIRIDGSGLLDKYTLIAKAINPSVRVVWEVHGFPEENYAAYSKRILIKISAHRFRRRWFSLFCSGYVFISEGVRQYSRRILQPKHTNVVIPNFIELTNTNTKIAHSTVFQSMISRSRNFFVMWAGDSSFSWNAIDVIEKVARRIYKKDKSITFVIIGPDPWYVPNWHTNIIRLGFLPHAVLFPLLQHAHVCLALYHQPIVTPFYSFPLKILEYMSLKKPIIASRLGEIPNIVTDRKSALLTDNTPHDIVEKILQLKKNWRFAKKLGTEAYTKVNHRYTPHAAQTLYTNVFPPVTGIKN